MSIDDLLHLGNERYVLLTTFRKNGEGVPTPVWCARDGDRLVITTGAESWKVKRIRANNVVAVSECDARGRVRKGVQPLVANASVFTDQPTLSRAESLLRDKYGIQFRLITWAHKLQRHAASRAVVELTLVDPGSLA